jgi:hypothetical protein
MRVVDSCEYRVRETLGSGYGLELVYYVFCRNAFLWTRVVAC